MRLYLALILMFALVEPVCAQLEELRSTLASAQTSGKQDIKKLQITPATKELNQAFYYVTVKERLDQIFKASPPSKSGKPLYGKVLLWLPLNADGTLFEGEGGPRIEQSSGVAALDQATIRTIREAAPFSQAPYLNPNNPERVVSELLVRLEFPDPLKMKRIRTETTADIGAGAPMVDSLQIDYSPSPAYPELARRNGEEGTVVVRTLVSESGIVKAVVMEQSSGHPNLDQAATEAVWSIRFKPYLDNWKPKAVWVKVPFTFKFMVKIGDDSPARFPAPAAAKLTLSDFRSIGERIRSNTAYQIPEDWTSNNPVEFKVSLNSNGMVTGVTMLKSSGLPDFDAAVRRAIEKSQPFPPASNGQVPSEFILLHRPQQLRAGN